MASVVLVLNDDGACRHLIAMAHVPDLGLIRSHPRNLLSMPRLMSTSSRTVFQLESTRSSSARTKVSVGADARTRARGGEESISDDGFPPRPSGARFQAFAVCA